MARSEPSDVSAYFQAEGSFLINLSTPNTESADERWIALRDPIASTKNGKYCALFQCGFLFTSDFTVYVARAQDSKHGIVAVKFGRASAIKEEARILKFLTDARVHGIARGYGFCYIDPFYAISMEFYQTSVDRLVESYGVMPLKKVAALGKDLVGVCHAYSGRSTQPPSRYLRYEAFTAWGSFMEM